MRTALVSLAVLVLAGCASGPYAQPQPVPYVIPPYQAQQVYQMPINRPAPQVQQPNTRTATWTGQSQPARTVTGQQAVSCVYQYVGQTFSRLFVSPSCPSSIEVQ